MNMKNKYDTNLYVDNDVEFTIVDLIDESFDFRISMWDNVLYALNYSEVDGLFV